jgi:peptide/nickel transport system ATP-binding protein
MSGGLDPLLEIRSLRVEISWAGRNVAVVEDVSLSIARGEAVALVGESGCGKTMTARAVLGLLPPGARRTAGQILFEGRDLARLDDRDLQEVRGEGIGVVFQEPSAALDPVWTVGDQIIEAIRLHRRVSVAAARDRARRLLEDVALPDPDRCLEEYPHRLSGGMRQRAMIAIALAADPRLLIADEPTTALDGTVQADILDLIDRLRRERDLALLLITHDLAVVAGRCDRVAVLYAGEIVEEAATAALFARPQHPYTRGLLRSMPRLLRGESRRPDRYPAIPGSPAAPGERPPGCAFAPRCPEIFEPCERARPPLYRVDSSLARCFLHDPQEGQRTGAL